MESICVSSCKRSKDSQSGRKIIKFEDGFVLAQSEPGFAEDPHVLKHRFTNTTMKCPGYPGYSYVQILNSIF